jgi:hypothetical protein
MTDIIMAHPVAFSVGLVIVLVLLWQATPKYRAYWLYVAVPAIFGGVSYENGNILYFYVFVFGMLTAFAEITNKFSDEPIKALGSMEALAYHLLNGAVACGALMTLLAYGVKANATIDKIKLVAVAGFGSMLIMRSKLFNVKLDDTEVAFGPEQVVTLFFRFMERAIDRLRAQARVALVTRQMNNLNFDKIKDYTKSMLQSAQTWNKDDREQVCKEIDEISSQQHSEPQLKSFDLGFLLLNKMGEDFLTTLYQPRKTEWLLSAPIADNSQTNLISKLIGGNQNPAYFSYGPNLSTQVFLSRLGRPDLDVHTFERSVKPVKAILKGYKAAFNRPVDPANPFGECEINLECDETGQVEGIVYQLNKDSLEYLNRTEPGYSLSMVKVKTEKGEDVECQAFMYDGVRGYGPPPKNYLASLLRGARQRHLGIEYINELEKSAKVVDRRQAPQTQRIGA